MFCYSEEVVGVGDGPDQANGVVVRGFFDNEIDTDDTGDESDEFDTVVEIGGDYLDGEAERVSLGEDADEIGSSTDEGGDLPGGELHGRGFTC